MNLEEFQNIMPISNIPSVLNHGILSHEMASRLPHTSVALQSAQDSRDQVRIPNGLKLHQYANVYFHARNPMMLLRRNEANKLCILRIASEILQIPGTVITDQNATSKYVRFYPSSMVSALRLEYIYARNWKHPENQIEEWKHSSAKGAEALVPQQIPFHFIRGAIALDSEAEDSLRAVGFTLPISINPDLFFR